MGTHTVSYIHCENAGGNMSPLLGDFMNCMYHHMLITSHGCYWWQYKVKSLLIFMCRTDDVRGNRSSVQTWLTDLCI